MIYIAPLLLFAAFLYPLVPGAKSVPCAIKFGLGVPCPGCGVTESVALALRGRWLESFDVHPLGFVVILWIFILWIAAVLKRFELRRGAGYSKISRRFSLFARIFSVIFVALLGACWLVKLTGML